MSRNMPVEGNAPSYNDAERGLVDVHTAKPVTTVAALPTSEAPSYSTDEKKAAIGSANFFPPPKEKDSATKTTVTVAARPSPKKKKKVSKWILWKIWFNTYRYV